MRWVLIGLLLLYLVTAPGEPPRFGDTAEMLRTSLALVEGRLGESETISKYGLGQSLLEAPLVGLYPLSLSTPPTWVSRLACVGLFSLPCALTALASVLLGLCCRRLGYAPSTAWVVAVLHGLTTMAWPYTQTLFADPTLGVLWTAALYAFIRLRQQGGAGWGAMAGAALGFSLLTKPAALVQAMVFAAALLAVRPRRRERLAFALPLLLGIALVLGYNQFRYAHPLAFGYDQGRDGQLGFSVPWWVGLYGLFLSSGKSLFLYNPTTGLSLLGVREFLRKHPTEGWLCLGLISSQALLACRWWAWSGDFAWGPRLLCGVPAWLLLLASPWLEKVRSPGRQFLLALLVLTATCVQLLGLLLQPGAYLQMTRSLPLGPDSRRDDLAHVHFLPEFSPVVGHVWLLRCLHHQRLLEPPWSRLYPEWQSDWPPAGVHLTPWWARPWRERSRGWPAALAMVTLMAGAGCACLARGLRRP